MTVRIKPPFRPFWAAAALMAATIFGQLTPGRAAAESGQGSQPLVISASLLFDGTRFLTGQAVL
ncbi:MAG TPA: hypothetical protein VFF88_01510, partial [Methylocella sp.]|nr:hypothetical protein [Methylocella sp.]